MEKDIQKQLEVIQQGTEDILLGVELKKNLIASFKQNKPLRVKLGLDPTAPDIHLGHTVVLNKLRQFQDLGHTAVLIIGDYTARIGDPSGRSTLRPKLSPEIIDKNSETYMAQAFKILDSRKIEILRNSEWLQTLKFEDILNLTSRFTVARMLERDDFKKRFKNNIAIAIMEFLYPVMQAYDSVAIKADIELGGTDQRFNLLMGRELQKEFGQSPQIAITMPILVGTDGINKMSKSLGNYIGVTEPPREIFGKIMSIPDNIMMDYFKLLTRLNKLELKNIEKDLKMHGTNPSIIKRQLAKAVISNLYSSRDAELAESNFDLIFKQRMIPDEVEEFCIDLHLNERGKIWIIKLIVDCDFAKSNGEARRLITQGAIKIGSINIENSEMEFSKDELRNQIIQKGKRHFKRIVIKNG